MDENGKSMTMNIYFSRFSYQNNSGFSNEFAFFVCVFVGSFASLEETFMEQPRYFLNVCDSVLSWIDEGKLPEQNAAGLKDGKLAESGDFGVDGVDNAWGVMENPIKIHLGGGNSNIFYFHP